MKSRTRQRALTSTGANCTSGFARLKPCLRACALVERNSAAMATAACSDSAAAGCCGAVLVCVANGLRSVVAPVWILATHHGVVIDALVLRAACLCRNFSSIRPSNTQFVRDAFDGHGILVVNVHGGDTGNLNVVAPHAVEHPIIAPVQTGSSNSPDRGTQHDAGIRLAIPLC